MEVEAIHQQVEEPTYAGFFIRFVAYVIDILILGLVQTIMIIPLLGLLGFGISLEPELTEEETITFFSFLFGLGALYHVIFIALGWLYFALMQSGTRQATIGKMAVGIYVTDIDGDRLSFARATLRYFGKYVSGAILMIGYLMALFTQKRQALHDIIANSIVVKKGI